MAGACAQGRHRVEDLSGCFHDKKVRTDVYYPDAQGIDTGSFARISFFYDDQGFLIFSTVPGERPRLPVAMVFPELDLLHQHPHRELLSRSPMFPGSIAP